MVSRTESSNLIVLLYACSCNMSKERCCHEADRHRTHSHVGSEVGECLAEQGRVQGGGEIKGKDHFVMRGREVLYQIVED
jgi:hypothetical protein